MSTHDIDRTPTRRRVRSVASDRALPASGHHPLLRLLRSGEPAEASRAVLEACFGLWSTEPELCEDGRATRLARLPAHGALYLTRTGEVLAARQTHPGDLFQARLFTGPADTLWAAVADVYPAAVPGHGTTPRFWMLREDVSPVVATYGVYDLLCFQVVERATDRDAVARRVRAANSASRPPAEPWRGLTREDGRTAVFGTP